MKEYLPIRILHDFTERVEKIGINYMLTGSMAMIRYTVFRQTADIDMIVEIERKDYALFVERFKNDYYIPMTSMSRAIDSRGMFNVIHVESAFKVDCVVRKNDEFQRQCFDRRERTDYYGREISIITCEDLILSKLLWSKDTRSDLQFRDIRNLLAVNHDAEYVSRWAKQLGLEENLVLLSKETNE